MSEVRVTARQVLFKEGEPANKLYLVKAGVVVCLKSSKDRLIPVFRAQNQDIIGENSMIAGSLYGYSAIALTNAELIEIPTSSFSQVLKEAPDWLVDLTSTMITRFQNTANLIAENRAMHPVIMNEEDFPSSLEVEFKKLLN